MSVITATITDNEENIQVVIATGGGGKTNLSYIASPTDGVVVSSTGTDATIPSATELDAGLFLPTEKTKLASIQAGAEANVNADWNATEGDALILNKPTLGTAAAANVGDFATAAQGNLADSSLQPSDIGMSVQGYSSVLANTTASFTTTDKSKLDGIAAGAEVNVNADWNAVAGDALILNKPTLGTAAFANVGDFATASQGTKADSALQPGTIGVTVQGYSSVLANTTASFTTADEAKLDGIEAGAEVNNISDANATDLTDGGETNLHIHDGRYYTETEINTLLSGKQDTLVSGTNIKTINGSSVLGGGDLIVGVDGQIINGVAHFVRPTAPSVRNDGSALQDNDRWYDSSTGREWVRRGIYWLSPRIETDRNITTNGSRGRNCFQGAASTAIYIHSAEIVYDLLTPFMNGSNYYNLSANFVGINSGNFGSTIFTGLNLFTFAGAGQNNAGSHPINTAFTLDGRRGTSVLATPVGSPGTLAISISFVYSLIYA